jgi:hypothetical protein
MPVVIDATVGGTSANSYSTLNEADTYHASHTNSSIWDAATTDQKNRALVMATRLLDQHVEWKGYASSDTQALQWPRIYVPIEKKLLLYPPGHPEFNYWGIYLPSDVIPQHLKDATAEFARQLLATDRTVDDDVSARGITRIAAGAVDISFKGTIRPNVVPDAVMAMLWRWGSLKDRAVTNVKLVRA